MLKIKIPSSKSISNRVLVLAAFAGRNKIIRNILKAEDTEVMFDAYKKLGVEYKILKEDKESLDIQIVNEANCENADFFMNNSGTSTRFLLPCLALLKGEFIIDGNDRMRERPIKDLVVALQDLGVRIEYLGNSGFLPLKIFTTGKLTGKARIKCDLSSQYLSGLMIARALTNDSFSIEILGDSLVSKPYIDLSKQVISDFLRQDEFIIETDYSSASYFIAFGILGNEPILIENIAKNSLQADKKFIDILINLGADLKFIGSDLVCIPSNLKVNKILEIDCTEFPDSAMTLAIVSSILNGVRTKLSGLSTLKHKECDRLLALETELNKVGIKTESKSESLTIFGGDKNNLNSVKIETYKDHRMAMCFALLKFFNHKIEILDPSCVNKTFPTFWDKFKLLTN